MNNIERYKNFGTIENLKIAEFFCQLLRFGLLKFYDGMKVVDIESNSFQPYSFHLLFIGSCCNESEGFINSR